MIQYRLVERPAFNVCGRKTWISGQDNRLFGQFWQSAHTSGLLVQLERVSGMQPGEQTHGLTLGISQVETDPTNRAFYYMIAVEQPDGVTTAPDLEAYRVPASTWAVFECRGALPDALVASEMYAFGEWLPASEYVHASAPEMEVYPPNRSGEPYCEFWLPVTLKP